jgi:hypothetical protein
MRQINADYPRAIRRIREHPRFLLSPNLARFDLIERRRS